MNRSCNSILCRFGIHTADPYVHIQVKCRNGSHRWQSNYEICKRCGKRLRKIRMANHNMNVTDVARAIFTHRNTVLYHLNKVKQQTGLDPRRFYDLVELVKMAQEVLENGS